MASDVLEALGRVRGARRRDRRVRGAAASADGAASAVARGEVVHDPEEAGQSAAAAPRASRAALERGAERVLLVPGDCPALEPGEVAELLGRAARRAS